LPTETRRTYSSQANEIRRTQPTQTVITDANILINLTHVGRLNLLGRLPGLTFVVTPDVLAEIVLPDQKHQVDVALAGGILRIEELSVPETIALFAELRHLMGVGEAASLALAIHMGWAVASDEKRAFRREALARLGPGRILTTPGLYLVAIRAGLLSVAEADADKARLETCRFKMEFSTFGKLVPPESDPGTQ
jgi:predicted nucleic acid-binding protein